MTRDIIMLLVFSFILTGCNKDEQRHEEYRRIQSRASWVYRSYQNERLLAKAQNLVYVGLPPTMPELPDGWSIVPRVQSENENADAIRIDAAVIYTPDGEQPNIWFFSEEHEKQVVVDPEADMDLYIEWVFSDCVFFDDYIIGLKHLSGLWEPVDSSVLWEHKTSAFTHLKYDNGAEEWLMYNSDGKIAERKLVRPDGTRQCVVILSRRMGIIVDARSCAKDL